MIITQDYIKSFLEYDPKTGVFTWLEAVGKVRAGRVAGSYDRGYKVISLKSKAYKAHRLAWLYVYGEFPVNGLDHINGIRSDNRIENLRDVPHKDNCKNQKRYKTNTSGVTGLNMTKGSRKWRAVIKVARKTIQLGTFDDMELAELVRKEAEAKYGFHENHGKVIPEEPS